VPAEADARICRTIRAGMLRVPKRAAAQLPHLTPQDVHTLDAELRAALAEVGFGLSEDPSNS
jgi:phage terminase Nu1 subunit (DNA packaging protein)